MKRMDVPFEFVEPYNVIAIRNHDQSLDKLQSRGGADAVELYWIMNGMKLFEKNISEPDAFAWIQVELGKWEAVRRAYEVSNGQLAMSHKELTLSIAAAERHLKVLEHEINIGRSIAAEEALDKVKKALAGFKDVR